MQTDSVLHSPLKCSQKHFQWAEGQNELKPKPARVAEFAYVATINFHQENLQDTLWIKNELQL